MGRNSFCGIYNLASFVLPASDLRWFTPTDAFWPALQTLVDQNPGLTFVDVGTGKGDLPAEARGKGFKMLGVDIRVPVPNPNHVELKEANQVTIGPLRWPVVCRPCHSGFPIDLLARAKASAAGFAYVGFRRNLKRDVGTEAYTFTVANVGQEKESLYAWIPKPRRRPVGDQKKVG